jgi:hypothetical protein
MAAGVPAGTMGRVSTSSPGRDAERPRAGETVLDAVLERITYTNEETGYTIARVADRSGSELLTVVGALLGVQPGGEPAAGRPVGFAPQVWAAVRTAGGSHGAATGTAAPA